MYLQITTKCNMTCAHCCYSCGRHGKHGEYNIIMDAIGFARNFDFETIAIGGGEPTLHPKFFDILKHCLENFDYVWFATNGSQTDRMFRLSNIIENCDYESFSLEDYCICETEEERENCVCEPEGLILQEDKLVVALSQDYYHDKIDRRIVDLWERKTRQGRHSGGYEIRNVTQSYSGVINQGRAKRTGVGMTDAECVCSDIVIKPDGRLKLCGCTNAPYIGDVWAGIASKWERVIYEDEKFNSERCFKALMKGSKNV